MTNKLANKSIKSQVIILFYLNLNIKSDASNEFDFSF